MKKLKTFIYTITSLACILILLFYFNYDTSKAFSNIVTFISINIGFCITALSIIANSSFSKKLFSIQDSHDNSKTLLHILISRFISAIIVFLTTIAFVFIYDFVSMGELVNINIIGKHFTLTALIQAFVWYLTILSFYKLISVLALLGKFIVRI